MINGSDEPISPVQKRIENGMFNASYTLAREQVRAVQNAGSVGLVVRPTFDAPIFLGFDNLAFSDGAPKLAGLLSNCGYDTHSR